MKKSLSAILVLACLFSVLPVYAHDEVKGANPSAYEHASDESIFIRVSDWFATVGKPEDEKGMIIAERRMNRVGKQAGKKMKKFGKDLENAFK